MLYCSMLRWNFDMNHVDPWAQCWVQRFNAKAAHFVAIVLKRMPPREKGMPKRLQIWLFGRVEVNEFGFGWNFFWEIVLPSTRTHTPDFQGVSLPCSPVQCLRTQKPCVWGLQLVGYVKLYKESIWVQQNGQPWHWTSALNIVPKDPHVPYQNFVSTCYSTAYEVKSYQEKKLCQGLCFTLMIRFWQVSFIIWVCRT